MWYLEIFAPGQHGFAERDRQERAELMARLAYKALDGLACAPRGALTTLSGLARGGVVRLARWQCRRRAIQALEALDDRMLRDIGLHRGEIRSLTEALLDRPAADAGPGPGADRPRRLVRGADEGRRAAIVAPAAPVGCG